MGIYDRDYQRNDGWNDHGGGAGFQGPKTAVGWILVTLLGVWLLQLAAPPLTGILSLPSTWFRAPWRVVSLFTYGLAHDTNTPGHLFWNALAVYFFGRTMQQRLGEREFVAFFFAAIAFGGFFWSLSTIVGYGLIEATMIGASAGVAALVVLFALCYPHQEVLFFGVVPMPAWVLGAICVGGDIWGAMASRMFGPVAYTAHLGGAAFAFAYYTAGWRITSLLPKGGVRWPSLKPRPRLRVHHEDSEAADARGERLDELLQKIQQHGRESLTREEQRFLEDTSRRLQRRKRE